MKQKGEHIEVTWIGEKAEIAEERDNRSDFEYG